MSFKKQTAVLVCRRVSVAIAEDAGKFSGGEIHFLESSLALGGLYHPTLAVIFNGNGGLFAVGRMHRKKKKWKIFSFHHNSFKNMCYYDII